MTKNFDENIFWDDHQPIFRVDDVSQRKKIATIEYEYNENDPTELDAIFPP